MGVIVACVPIVLAVAGPLLERRPLSGRVVVAAGPSRSARPGVQWTDGGITMAGVLALGALACESSFSLLAAPHLPRLGPLAVSTYACLLALPLLAAWSVASGGPRLPAPDASEAAALLRLAVAVTTDGFLCWYTAIGIMGVERAVLLSGVLPVSALAWSAATGAAELTPGRLLAVGVVAAGSRSGCAALRRGPYPPRRVLEAAQRADRDRAVAGEAVVGGRRTCTSV